MKISNDIVDIDRGSKKRRRIKVLGCVCGVAPLCLVILFATYKHNNRSVDVAVTKPSMPAPNGYDDFVRAEKMSRSMVHKPPFYKYNPTYSFAEFQAAAKDAQPALAAMRKGLGEDCRCPPIRTLKAFGSDAGFDHMAHASAAVSICYELSGDPAKAADVHLDALQTGVMLNRGGAIHNDTWSIRCESTAAGRFELLLPKLSERELAHVAARLDTIAAMQTPFSDIVREEGFQWIAIDVELLKDPKGSNFNSARDMIIGNNIADAAFGHDNHPDHSKVGEAITTIKVDWEAFRFAAANKQRIIDDNRAYYDGLYREALDPYKVGSAIPIPDNPLMQVGICPISLPRARHVSMEAVIAIYRTEVALTRYKMATGHYPAALEVLAPTYIPPNAFTDPFTGKSLRYHPTKKGQSFLLYSVGPDLIDNHGTPSKYVGFSPGDIVAGHMWKVMTLKK